MGARNSADRRFSPGIVICSGRITPNFTHVLPNVLRPDQPALGALFPGWLYGAVCDNTFNAEEPVFPAEGDLDMPGARLRGNVVYNPSSPTRWARR